MTSLSRLIRMHRYSIYDAKAKLSEIIRLVKQRKAVVITERGKLVARIIPYEEDTFQERFSRLCDGGIVSSEKETGLASVLADSQPVEKREGALQRFLDERSRF